MNGTNEPTKNKIQAEKKKLYNNRMQSVYPIITTYDGVYEFSIDFSRIVRLFLKWLHRNYNFLSGNKVYNSLFRTHFSYWILEYEQKNSIWQIALDGDKTRIYLHICFRIYVHRINWQLRVTVIVHLTHFFLFIALGF